MKQGFICAVVDFLFGLTMIFLVTFWGIVAARLGWEWAGMFCR